MKRQALIITFFQLSLVVVVFFALTGCGKGSSISSLSSTASSIISTSSANSFDSANMSADMEENVGNSSIGSDSYMQPNVSAIIQSMQDETSKAVESLQALNRDTAPQLLEFMADAQSANADPTLDSYINFNISAQGNTLILSYKYLVDVTVDQVKQAEEQVKDFYTNQVQIFKNEGVSDAAIHEVYYDKNGHLIYEQDYN